MFSKSSRVEKWQGWLSQKRLGDNNPPSQPQGRSKFDQDYDRIIFSSPFRRLQDKTQVFPLSQSDYTRTRLTHSLEVACVGRSLGYMAGEILEKDVLDLIGITPNNLGTIVATSCLAHDVGNPPFGHSGEDAIQAWAKRKLEVNKEKVDALGLDESQRQDFLEFEGNAQSFRIFCKTQGRERDGGLRLTLANYGALFKYPRPSCIEKNFQTAHENDAALKKFGYFKDDERLAQEVFDGLGLHRRSEGVYARHPLAFLMEAADDICYAIIDLEDACDLGVISYNELEELVTPLVKGFRPNKNYSDGTKIRVLRSAAIESLTLQCAKIFQENLKAIEDGEFSSSLIDRIGVTKEYAELKKTARKKVYNNDRVLQIEYAGYQTIGGLLDYFCEAIVTNNESQRDAKLRQLMPIHYLRFPGMNYESVEEYLGNLTRYQRLLTVTDYISGMTDRYAVDLYQNLSGIKLPS